MKYNILKLIVLAALSISKLQAGTIESAITAWWNGKQAIPSIKVLIVHDQPGVVLEVKGKYKLFDPHANSYISTRYIGKRKFIQALADGLKWGEEFPGIHQIEIVPDDPRTTTLVDGVEYKGSIYVYDIGGTVSVINEVPIEDYLKVLLVPQFDRSLPAELAASIAIAARTNAWYQSKNSGNSYWSVEADKVGYQGSPAAASHNGLPEAIDTTRHMILVKNGQAFQAEWGSAEGGAQGNVKPVFSRITLFDAEDLAKKGELAAKILNSAFPDSSLTLIEKVE